MDRIRTDRPHPTWLRVRRIAGAGLALFAIVLGVGSLPVVFVYFWSGPIEAPAVAWEPEFETSFFSGEALLAGSLHLPPGPGPHPAAVVVHGSGRQTRSFGRSVAEQLLPLGVAVLAYDKRGVGASQGDYSGVGVSNSTAQLSTLADDALSGVEYLLGLPEIDPTRVGLFGVSQAGWIVPLAASRAPGLAFTVLISGPTVSVGEEIYYSGLTGDDFGTPTDLDGEALSTRFRAFEGARGFDPRSTLTSLDVDGLWIFGSLDRSIPVPESIEILEELRNKGRPFDFQLYRGANHGMVDLETGERVDYWPDVHEWLQQRLGL